jgi:hypothetical protein
VFVQLIDPAAFGGREAFVRETGWLAEGVVLHAGIMPGLEPWAKKLGVALP